MKAIETLMNEHQIILEVLDALEKFAADISSGRTKDHRDFAHFAEFFSSFADRFHHGKEEDILFEEMQRHEFSKNAGPLAVMYYEHDLGRSKVRLMREAGESDTWNEDIRSRTHNAAATYVTLLRNHIDKEDNVLYPMAQQRLPEEVFTDMAHRFDDFKTHTFGTDAHTALRSLGERLIKKYRQQQASSTEGSGQDG